MSEAPNRKRNYSMSYAAIYSQKYRKKKKQERETLQAREASQEGKIDHLKWFIRKIMRTWSYNALLKWQGDLKKIGMTQDFNKILAEVAPTEHAIDMNADDENDASDPSDDCEADCDEEIDENCEDDVPRLTERTATEIRTARGRLIAINDASFASSMYEICLSNSRNCMMATRMTIKEYEELEERLLPFVKVFTARGRRKRAGKAWLVPDRVQIFLYLYYTKHYPTFWAMSMQFALCELYLNSIFCRVSLALQALAMNSRRAEGGILMPSPNELKEIYDREVEMRPTGMDRLLFAVDGVRFHIEPEAGRTDLWNKKDHMPSVIFLMMCTLEGDIVWKSELSETQDEDGIINRSGLRDVLEKSTYAAVADAGETLSKAGMEAVHYYCIGPEGLRRSKDLLRSILGILNIGKIDAALGTLFEAIARFLKTGLHNARLASKVRVVIENVFRDLKGSQILSSIFRQYHRRQKKEPEQSLKLSVVVDGLVFLQRFSKLHRPYFARRPDWKLLNTGAKYVRLYDKKGVYENAKRYEIRVRNLAGEKGKRLPATLFEVGSDAFVENWERFVGDAPWRPLVGKEYRMSPEFEAMCNDGNYLLAEMDKDHIETVAEEDREKWDAAVVSRFLETLKDHRKPNEVNESAVDESAMDPLAVQKEKSDQELVYSVCRYKYDVRNGTIDAFRHSISPLLTADNFMKFLNNVYLSACTFTNTFARIVLLKRLLAIKREKKLAQLGELRLYFLQAIDEINKKE